MGELGSECEKKDAIYLVGRADVAPAKYVHWRTPSFAISLLYPSLVSENAGAAIV